MWLRQWTVKLGITILLGSTPPFIQWFSQSHTQGILNWGRVLRTQILMFYLIWYEVIIGLNAVFWPYFVFIKVRNYVAPNFTTKDFRIQVRGSLVNYVYGCQLTPVTRRALGYVPYQRSIIQGHLVHRYASRRAPVMCSNIVFRTVLSLDVSTQAVFLYYMSVKYIFKGYFWCPCYALVVMSNRWNQYKFSTLCRLWISLHRWILVLLLIFVDWNNHSNTNVAGSKCILNRYWCIIWSPNAIVMKMSSLDNGLHNKFGLYVFSYFHWFWIWYISSIHCAKFEVYTCSICDVVTIPITACSSSFNRLKCC